MATNFEKVIILESGKCSWGKCIFCSFGKKEPVALSLAEFKERIERSINGKINALKFFNSGSFLDEAQISKEMRQYLFAKCKESGISELIVECRAEHVNEKKLDEIKCEINGGLKLTFAIGLEVADDGVLKKICKGMTLGQYGRAVGELRKAGFGVRTYLMANLPFVGDVKKSLDASVNYALKHSDSIAIINAFAYGYSPLFEIWLKGTWHPLDKKEFDGLTKKYKKNPKINIYFDDYVTYPKFPENMQKKLVGVGKDYVLHPYFNVWQEYLSRFYNAPECKKFALFLPCSFRKPYSQSRTHLEILRRLIEIRQYPLIHQIMVSNPGVIPREFENKYPFAHYDWQEWLETPQIKKEYIEATQNRLEDYLKTHKYLKVFSYLKPTSESFIALKGACTKLKIPLISCIDEKMFYELKEKEPGLIKTDDRERHENILIERRMLDKLVEIFRKNLSRG